MFRLTLLLFLLPSYLPAQTYEALLANAQARTRNGQLDLALEVLNQAVQLKPNEAEAYWRRAEIYAFGQNQLSKAQTDWNKAIQYKPAPALRSRIGYYLSRKNYTLALADANLLVKSEPDTIQHYTMRAYIQRQNKQYQAAVSDLLLAEAKDTTTTDVLVEQGQVYDDMNEPAKAVAALAKAVQRKPTDALLWNNLAYYRMKTGALPQALEEVNRSLAISPASPHTLDTKADILIRLGQRDEACKLYALFLLGTQELSTGCERCRIECK